MRIHRYPRQFRSDHREYINLVSSGIFCLLIIVAAIADFQSLFQSLLEDIVSGLLTLGGIFALLVFNLYKINMYPNLTTSENGLGVEFLSFYVPVPWKDVESIHLIQDSSYPEKFKEWFVKTKKLTLLHLLYGKFKYGDYVIGFVIRSELENVQQVLDEIKSRLPADKYQVFYKA